MTVNRMSEPDPNEILPDHVPDELVRMYGREAEHSVRYSRSRRYRVSRQVHKASVGLHDVEIWSAAGLVFFWGIAALALVGGLAYAVFLWPAAGLSMVATVALLSAVALTVGVRTARKQREQPVEQYPNYSF
jgi:hypothetical protein